MGVHDLPALNASLNALSGTMLLAGYAAIKSGRRDIHKRCMLAAVAASTLFLISYVVYHAQVGSIPFTRQGPVRLLYFVILVSHVILAASVVPLAAVSLTRGLKGQFGRHRQIARWTFPIWMYVSITGVLVFILLYKPAWLL